MTTEPDNDDGPNVPDILGDLEAHIAKHSTRTPDTTASPVSSVIHRCPRAGEHRVQCCNASVFRLDAFDRMTLNDDLVTCRHQALSENNGSQ